MDEDVGLLIEQLGIANTKLFKLCDLKAKMVRKPHKYSKEQVIKLLQQDLALCNERSRLRRKINNALGAQVGEVKNYG